VDFGLALDYVSTGEPSPASSTPEGAAAALPELAAQLLELDEPQPGTGGSTRSRLTLPGMVMGTPSYMAPEQVQAALRGSPVDERADQYALGCMLHEMVSGQRPFAAPKVLELLQLHLQKPPQPLRQ